MSTLSTHTASGQALGYFFQLERALFWLGRAPADSIIGLETEDDVVVKLLNGDSFYEQDKSSVNSHPFLPGKKDLWKSLLIWAEAIDSGEVDVEHAHFFLVTNKPKEESLALKLSEAKEEVTAKSALTILKQEASKITGEVKLLIDKLFNYPEDLLVKLIIRINYQSGGNVYGDGLKKRLQSDLQLDPDDDEQNASIIRELLAWVFDQVVTAWRDKRPAFIDRNEFVRLKNNLFTNYRQKVVDSILITLGQIPTDQEHQEWKNIYVKQLELVKCEKDEIHKAIFEYLNSVASRTQLAKKGYLTAPQLEELDKSLENRWEAIAKLKKLSHSQLAPEVVGQLILWESMNYDTSIGKYVLRGHFLTKGSYHALADKLKVGWHPDYKLHIVPYCTDPLIPAK